MRLASRPSVRLGLVVLVVGVVLALWGWPMSRFQGEGRGVEDRGVAGPPSLDTSGDEVQPSWSEVVPGSPLALAHERLASHDLEGALGAYEALLAAAHEEENPQLTAASLSGLGMVYKRLGDYHQAITLYGEALEICRTLGDWDCQAEMQHNLGACYTLLGELPLARDVLTEALELWSSGSYESSSTLTALATLDDLEGEHDKAIEVFRQAILLRCLSRQVDAKRRRLGLGNTLDRLATAYKHAGRLEDARRAYEKALDIWRRGGYLTQLALTRQNLGWLHLKTGEPGVALEHFAAALPLLEGSLHDKAHGLLGMGKAHRQLGNLEAASARLEEATGIIESLRSHAYSQLLRASFLARRQPFYELTIEVLMERHRAAPGAGFDGRALEVAERFRARGLLDLLSVERTALREVATGEHLELENLLHQQMVDRDRERLELLDQGAPAREIARIEREQRSLVMRYDHLRAQLWAQLRPGLETGLETGLRPEVKTGLPSSQMMALLEEETVLLVYSLGEERSFLWQVNSQEIVSHELPSRHRIEETARQVYGFLQRSDQRGGRSKGSEAMEELSRLLLGPLQLESLQLESKRLLIMADGLLHYIPFAVLTTPSGRPLVADHEIVSLPSASVLKVLRDRAASRPPQGKTLAVLADPVFRFEDPRVVALGLPATAEKKNRTFLERLEHSGQEARAILEFVPPDERFGALGFEATRQTLLDGKLAGYRIVHFATHGELNDEQPEFSHLVLSLLDERGLPMEGRLYQHEIGNLEMPADLVVLSACNSALGKHVRGEGLVGMTRGFMDAGASRVLVSLWYVSDEATALLMERFYEELLVKGKTPPAALQAAQLWLRGIPRWESPFYWAGFVLQGEWR